MEDVSVELHPVNEWGISLEEGSDSCMITSGVVTTTDARVKETHQDTSQCVRPGLGGEQNEGQSTEELGALMALLKGVQS